MKYVFSDNGKDEILSMQEIASRVGAMTSTRYLLERTWDVYQIVSQEEHKLLHVERDKHSHTVSLVDSRYNIVDSETYDPEACYGTVS